MNWYEKQLEQHRKWSMKQKEYYNNLPYEKVRNSGAEVASFISGQLSGGYYDYQDLFGDYGHIAGLYIIQEVLNSKATEENIENPIDFFESTYELMIRDIEGPANNQGE